MFAYNESSFENSIIELFENLGYQHIYAPDLDRTEEDLHCPFILEQLYSSLETINPLLSRKAIEGAVFKISNYEVGSLTTKNEIFTDYLQNGVEVSYQENGEEKNEIVNLVDYANPSMNSMIVANQWTYKEYETKRPDIVIFLNGIPVVVFELKSPKADSITIENAYLQIQNYKKSIESFFIYNAFFISSYICISF